MTSPGKKMMLRGSAAAATVAALAAGIASATGPASEHVVIQTAPASSPAPTRDDVRYPGIGARIRTTVTESERARATVSPERAIGLFRHSGVRQDLVDHPRTVTLSVFSDDTFGPAGKDGLPVPKFQNQLAWVITVPDAPAPLYGPAGTPPSLDRGCDYVYVVDAVTGEPMTAFQSCTKS